MSTNENLSPEVKEYIDKLTEIVQNNKEAVDIYNLVDKTHKGIFPNNNLRLSIYLGIGLVFLVSLFYLILSKKSSEPINNIQNSTINLNNKESSLNNSDSSLNISGAFIDSIPKIDTSHKTLSLDSSIKTRKLNNKDSVIDTYLIKIEKSRYKIFDVSAKIIELIKSNDYDILISDISREKGKIFTRNKADYSNTFGKMIFYNIEYYIFSDDLEYNIKMNLINKSSNIDYSNDKEDKIPNSVEKKFYELMKLHISSFYGD